MTISARSPNEIDVVGQVFAQAGLARPQPVVAERALLRDAPLGHSGLLTLCALRRGVVGAPVLSLRRSTTPNGQPATQVPQPLQMSDCTTTVPNSVRIIAPVGLRQAPGVRAVFVHVRTTSASGTRECRGVGVPRWVLAAAGSASTLVRSCGILSPTRPRPAGFTRGLDPLGILLDEGDVTPGALAFPGH